MRRQSLVLRRLCLGRVAGCRADLAYAQCMQTHGLPGFPDPNPSGGPSISIHGQPAAGSPAARANDACEHLPPAGSTRTGGATAPATTSPPGAAAADCPGSFPCYTPRQLRAAYGIQPLLDRGIDGRGVTVALPEEAETGPARPQPVSGLRQAVTDIRKDLAEFRQPDSDCPGTPPGDHGPGRLVRLAVVSRRRGGGRH